jgi:hypothetical protein
MAKRPLTGPGELCDLADLKCTAKLVPLAETHGSPSKKMMTGEIRKPEWPAPSAALEAAREFLRGWYARL